MFLDFACWIRSCIISATPQPCGASRTVALAGTSSQLPVLPARFHAHPQRRRRREPGQHRSVRRTDI